MESKNQEKVDAFVMEGASIDEIKLESKRRAALGEMCIIFPNQILMDLWLRRIATPLK